MASYPHKNAKVRACALLTELYSKLPCHRAGGGAESGAGTHKSGPSGSREWALDAAALSLTRRTAYNFIVPPVSPHR